MAHHEPMGCRSLPRQIHHIRNFTGFFELPNYAHCLCCNRLLRLIGRSANVMRAIKSGLFGNLIRKLSLCSRGLVSKNIKSGTDGSRLHCLDQRRVINDFTTRRVYKVGPFAHCAKKLAADQSFRLRFQCQMHAYYVRLVRDVMWIRLVFDPELLSTLGSKTAAPGNHAHAESSGPRNHFLADFPDANQTEGATIKTARFRKLLLVPLAAPQADDVVGYTPIERQDESKRQLSYRN